MHVTHLDLDSALLVAFQAANFPELLERHFPSPLTLDGPTELLPQLMRGYLDLIKMWHPITLLKRLNLGRY